MIASLQSALGFARDSSGHYKTGGKGLKIIQHGPFR